MSNMFGKYIKELRVDRELSLRQVEAETGISNSYLSQIERGERGIPNSKIIVRLAELYGVSFQSLAQIAGIQASAFFNHAKRKNTKVNNIPVPDEKFIIREYKKLNDQSKELLKTFLQFLSQRK